MKLRYRFHAEIFGFITALSVCVPVWSDFSQTKVFTCISNVQIQSINKHTDGLAIRMKERSVSDIVSFSNSFLHLIHLTHNVQD